jgi:TonB family protein
VLLDRLESGFLVFETQQGMVRADLSLKQRIYLLWTFRHFRQLSMPLLNSRQRALVNRLFQTNAGIHNVGVHSDSNEFLPVIGVVENFVPSFLLPDDLIAIEPLREHSGEQTKEVLAVCYAEHVLMRSPEAPSTMGFAWHVYIASGLKALRRVTPKLAMPRLVIPKLFSSSSSLLLSLPKTFLPKLSLPKLSLSGLSLPRFGIVKTAITVGSFVLCILFVIAWIRIQETPNSEADNQMHLPQIGAVALASSAPALIPAVTRQDRIEDAPSRLIAEPRRNRQSELKRKSYASSKASLSASSKSSSAERSTKTAPRKQSIQVRDEAALPNLPLREEDTNIQASRAPLHVVYPACPRVHSRTVVALTARVDPDGAVRTVKVVSGKRTLAAAAVRAIRQWRYRPFIKDGQPVATETNIVITFIADDAVSMSFPPSIPSIR